MKKEVKENIAERMNEKMKERQRWTMSLLVSIALSYTLYTPVKLFTLIHYFTPCTFLHFSCLNQNRYARNCYKKRKRKK